MDSILAWPLDNTEYTAIALGAYNGTRTRGVFSDDGHFAIKANSDMSVTVSPGLGWLKMAEYWGVAILVLEPQVLTPVQPDGSLTRIDPVCLRIDKNQNRPELVLKTGEYANDPQIENLPAPTQNLDYDEIYVGALRIRAGAIEILDTDIYDLRLDENYCGIMRDGVTGIPTQALYDMWLAWFNAHKAETQAYYANYQQMAADLYIQYKAEIAVRGENADAAYDGYIDRMTRHETNFIVSLEEYMETIKGILGEDEAANLLLLIQDIQKRVPTIAIGTVSTRAATTQLYPLCALYRTEWGFGLGGAGVGPAGGSSAVAIDAGFEYDGDHNVEVTVPAQYGAFTDINQLSDTMYAFSDGSETTRLVLRIAKEV